MSFLLKMMVATMAFFVIVVLLTSLNAMFSFHSYRHRDNQNEIKWLKHTKKSFVTKYNERFLGIMVYTQEPIFN